MICSDILRSSDEAFEFGWGFVVAAVPELDGFRISVTCRTLDLVAIEVVTADSDRCETVNLTAYPYAGEMLARAAERARLELDAILREIERVHCIDPASFL